MMKYYYNTTRTMTTTTVTPQTGVMNVVSAIRVYTDMGW